MKLRIAKEEKSELQMAPMIDIIFQLIIFFMVVTQLNKLEVPEDIKLPVAEESADKSGNPNQIIVNVYKDGRIFITPEYYDLDGLFKLLGSEEKKGMLKVYIRGDKMTQFADIMDVMKTCAEAGIWDVSFSTYQEPSPE